jgi:hypothetical protein
LILHFPQMGEYTASTFTSHIPIPFNYSSLMNLKENMNDRLDYFFDVLHDRNFNVTYDTVATLKNILKLYKDNTNQIFKLFNDLLTSLPHVQERHCRQWDIASFVAAMAALSLATYNNITIY